MWKLSFENQQQCQVFFFPPAQLYIPVCTVTESCDLVCCPESLTKWATGSHGRCRDAHATDICKNASSVYLNSVWKIPWQRTNTRDKATKVTDTMLTSRDHGY